MKDLAKFREQYQQGKKDFIDFNLRETDLKGMNLSHLNFQGSDFTKANLTETILDEANFSNTNLTEAILDRASLIKTNLERAKLSEASFFKTKLVRASLKETDLSKANFNNAFLTISCLDKTLLTGASFEETAINGTSFQEADLTDVDLSKATIRNTKFNLAYYNYKTSFDSNFDPIEAGMQKMISIEDITTDLLAETFNSLYQLGRHYLGGQMIDKYWQSSRPDRDWLNQFKIDDSAQIIFVEEQNLNIDRDRLQSYKKWLDNFIQSCSLIIQDFPKMVKEKELICFELTEVFKQVN